MIDQKKMFVKVWFVAMFLISDLSAQHYIETNVGLIPSKSSLGISVGAGSNEINVGLKGNPLDLFATRDFIAQPGITYNRLLHSSGIYGSFTYAPVYVKMDQSGSMTSVGVASRDPVVGSYYFMEDGWNAGEVFVGLGKSTQFGSWAVNVDGNVITPAKDGFVRSWFYQFGLGVSYRFRSGK